ncbi:MFS general substrate transporter [Cadophora sp. DSE1049]|nr:MFS general substrate transporter [Cadophora sp. DSE1049]
MSDSPAKEVSESPTVERREAYQNNTQQKTNKHGIILVPQPSDDSADPLNWPLWKKNGTLGIISLASLAGAMQDLANASGLFPQAIAYNTTVTRLTYTLSASAAGIGFGPLFWTPLALRLGRTACIFWGTLLSMVFNIWAATCTDQGDYIQFVLARMFAALAASASITIGATIVVDIFFLHEHGCAYAVYILCCVIGPTTGPTLSGFIVQTQDWPVQFYHNIALEGFVCILAFLFLNETGYARPQVNADGTGTIPTVVYPEIPKSFLANRTATFITGKVVPRKTTGELLYSAVLPFLIFITPVGFMAGMVLFVNFGWGVAVNTLQSVYLQSPGEAGGYGFSPLQNALFTFSSWAGIACAQIYGLLFNDRIPIWVCKRFGKGVWKPEYRLHTLWAMILFMFPTGMGLYAASLQYHLHYMVLALAQFLMFWGGSAAVPTIVNYVVECFGDHGNEVSAYLNFMRVVFGLTIPFYITPWTEAVSVGWVFGTMALLSVGVFGFIIALIAKGHELREFKTWGIKAHSEEGTMLVQYDTATVVNVH